MSSPPASRGRDRLARPESQIPDSRRDVACSTQLSKSSSSPIWHRGPRIRGRIDSTASSLRIWLGSLLPTTLWGVSLAEQLLRLHANLRLVKPSLQKKSSLAVGQSQSRARTATSLTNRASLARRAICAPPGGRAPIFPLTMAPLVARFGLARAGIHDPIRRLRAPVRADMPGERSPASALQMEKRYESRTLHRPVCEAQP
jgi:hypothetical protein